MKEKSMDEISKMIEDTKKKIADAINESGLPISIIEMILTEYQNQIQIIKLKGVEDNGDNTNV